VKKIYTAADPLEAGLIRGLLESSGIESQVRGLALWGARGLIPITPDTAPSVWVRDEDAELAKTLIASRSRPLAVVRDDWKCSTCGENVDGEFSECWSCGTAA
jgi:hypothetical protein